MDFSLKHKMFIIQVVNTSGFTGQIVPSRVLQTASMACAISLMGLVQSVLKVIKEQCVTEVSVFT